MLQVRALYIYIYMKSLMIEALSSLMILMRCYQSSEYHMKTKFKKFGYLLSG